MTPTPWMATAALLLLAMPACAATAAAPSVRSDVDGIRIVSATTLPAPRRPMTFEPGHFCRSAAVDAPRTRAGRAAAALGWSVTSEVQAGSDTAVGVFSRGGQGTSGTCFINDGNIVIYRAAQPVAIVYGDAPADDAGGPIGGVVKTLTANRLRISDWTPVGFEHADIVLAADRIQVLPIAAKETACGNVTIPNLRGKAIPEARKLLAPYSWSPARFPVDDAGAAIGDAAAEYRKQGLTEFEGCSGTGYGFCNVGYTHRSGAVLDVTTVGDEPEVARYTVTCAGDGTR